MYCFNVYVRIEELHLDGLHEGGCVEAVGAEVFEEGADGPLVAAVVRLEVVAGHVVGVVLVDGVVTQVHARVPQVAPRHVVLHSREPGNTYYNAAVNLNLEKYNYPYGSIGLFWSPFATLLSA